MHREITRDIRICDACLDKEASYSCKKCSKDFCYECVGSAAVIYRHGVYSQGSGDGCYCLDCNADLIAKPTSEFRAYRAIAALRAESEAWSEDFRTRMQAAEKNLERIQAGA